MTALQTSPCHACAKLDRAEIDAALGFNHPGMEAPTTAKRGRGRPPLSPEQKAIADEKRRKAKAERQRERREGVKNARDRIANIVTSARVSRNEPVKVHRGAATHYTPTDEDRARVMTQAGLGTPHDQIALMIINPATLRPISEDTLRSHYAHELALGPAHANSSVSKSMFQMATGTGGAKRSMPAAAFWLKARAGWRETQHVEVDLRAGVLVAPAGVSPEKWIEAARSVDVAKLEPGGAERQTG